MSNNNDKNTERFRSIPMKLPMLNLRKDSRSVIEKALELMHKEAARAYNAMLSCLGARSFYDYDDDYDWDDFGYGDTGFGLSDEEWAEAQAEAYERDIRRFEEISGIPMRKNNSVVTKKKGFGSQKFINGIEVSDDEWEEYQKKGKIGAKATRRAGRKHKNRTIKTVHGTQIISSPNKHSKKTTRYNDDDWWDDHENDRESLCNEQKDITFYRNLPDKTDVYMFTNLLEFDEWIQENEIRVDYCDSQELMYNIESHCCIDPFSNDKILMVARSYDELVDDATGGDAEMLNDESNTWNRYGL